MQKKYLIVSDAEDLECFLAHIRRYKYLAFDTETTGLNVRQVKVIGFSICGKPGEAYYFPIETWDSKKEELIQVHSKDLVIEILLKLQQKELIMWNGSFDIRVVKNCFGIDLTESLFVEAMLLKHTLEEEGDFALKKVAVQNQKALGFDAETEANQEQINLKENVKKNGGTTTRANYEMFKADLMVMGPYAAADADLTLQLALLYRTKMEKENLEKFFYDDEVMPTCKYITIPMEENGIKLDLQLVEQAKVNITKDIANLEKEIIEELMMQSVVLEWYKVMLDDKYPISPKGSFGQKVAGYYNFELPKTASGKYSLTEKNIRKYCSSGIGMDFLLGEASLDGDVVYELQQQLHIDKSDKIINISSKKQMGEIVFDFMGIKPLSKTDKGQPQFNDDMIQSLVEKEHAWAKKLSDYNKLIKIRGTYIDRFLDNHEDGYYYFRYKQHGTISGRFGSDAQQLPRPKEEGELSPVVLKYNNMIRSFFITEEDRIFIDADYESLEPHVFAHVSGDEGLREIFRKGHDFYSTIAIKTEKLQGVSADKKADNYLGKVNKPLRQKAKAYCLGIAYGLEAFKLSKTLEIDQKEAQKLIDGYLDGFPKLKQWMDQSHVNAKATGFIKSQAGRVRHLDKVKTIYKTYGDKLLNFKYRKSIEKKLGKDEVLRIFRDYKNGLNNAKNFQIQSLAASIVNKSAIAIVHEFKNKNIDGKIVAQIHDQIIFDVAKEDLNQAKDIIQKLMETTTKLSVDLKAPPEIAKNWKDSH